MENISSYGELLQKTAKREISVLILYKSGSEQSECAIKNAENAIGDMKSVSLFAADVTVVRDIHEQYGVTSVPTLLLFKEGRMSGMVKGCQGPEFFRAVSTWEILRDDGQKVSEKASRNVIVYSTPACTWCNTLKTWLRSNKISFRDIDVSSDQHAAESMVRRSGQQGVPQTEIDGRIIVGFDQAKLKEILGIK